MSVSEAYAGLMAPGERLLIAEDNPQYRELLKLRLGMMEKYEVTATENGLEAMAKLEELRPVAIVTDIEMPEIDGLGLCRRVRADDRHADIPILLLSSSDPSAELARVIDLGQIVWLSKTSDWNTVSTTLRALIEGNHDQPVRTFIDSETGSTNTDALVMSGVGEADELDTHSLAPSGVTGSEAPLEIVGARI